MSSLTPTNRDASQGGGNVFPYPIDYSALIEDSYSSTGEVAADCTIALGWKPTNASTAPLISPDGHYLLTIQKQGSTVRFWKQDVELGTYGGSVGSTYAEFVQNVLTYYAGSYYGYYSRLVVTEQALDYSTFWDPSDLVTGLWVPKELDLPYFTPIDYSSTMFTGGTPSLQQSDYGDGFQVFVDNTGYSANELDAGSAPKWAQYVLPAAKTAAAYDMVASASYYNGHFPLNWTVEGSNDGSNWTTIDTRTGQSAGSAGLRKRYVIQNPGSYTHYRLNISATNSGQVIVLAAWLMYEQLDSTQYGPGGGLYLFDNALDLGEDAHVELGEELIDDVTAWTNTSYGTNVDVVEFPSGVTQFASTGKDILELGKKYTVTATIAGLGAGEEVNFKGGAGASNNLIGVNGDVSQTIEADGTTGRFIVQAQDSFVGDVTITNISVKEITAGRNDWLVNGSPVQTVDTPTNNFCTLNPLEVSNYSGTAPSISNGNLSASWNAATFGRLPATFPLPDSGKWYWEVTVDTSKWSAGGITWGRGLYTNEVVAANEANLIYIGGASSSVSGLTALAANDVIGCCYDADSQEFQLKVNNTNRGSAVDISGFTMPMFPCCGDESGSDATAQTMNFGATGFTYTPPSGFLPLSSANLPDPAIMRSSSGADIVLRDGVQPSTSTISLPDMAGGPDFIAGKDRDFAYPWIVMDTEQGSGQAMFFDSTSGASLDTGRYTFTGADGYDVGSNTEVAATGDSFIDLCLKAGVDQGFEIVTYTGTGVARTVAHNLGKAPTFMIVKRIDAAAWWIVYHVALGATKGLVLQRTDPAATSSGLWNNTEPTSSVFTVGTNAALNALNGSYVAYLFTDSDIFKAFSYTGNGSADGPFVNLGGRPLSIPWFKDSATAGGLNWLRYDAAREPFNPIGNYLLPNTSGTEVDLGDYLSFTSQGVKVNVPNNGWNASGALHVGLAILESTIFSNAY
jgi:hypothetical protein